MSNTLPPLPPRRDSRTRPNAGQAPSLPPIPAPDPTKPDANGNFSEFLMVTLVHDVQKGVTSVSFEGKGFDADNDDIVVDILGTAAMVFNHTIVADEDVTWVDENGDDIEDED